MSTWMSGLCRRLLAAAGWRVVYEPPLVNKAVIVFYPHTSNWDFIVGILARTVIELPVRFAAKDSLFAWPLGAAFRAMGGIPVNRRERTGFVAQMAARCKQDSVFYLAITPEGTRRLTPGWKSGFYRLALAAQVPLGLAFIDYARREVGIMGYLELTGDEGSDFDQLRAAYASRVGRHPGQQSPIAPLAAEQRNST